MSMAAAGCLKFIAVAADFLKIHRGSGRLFKIHHGSDAAAVDFLKIHRSRGSIFFRGH
jgi:hypothetical protein